MLWQYTIHSSITGFSLRIKYSCIPCGRRNSLLQEIGMLMNAWIKSIDMYEEKLKIYDELVSKCSRFERKGKTVPYTSANGHMFSLLNKAGEIGIRFSKEVQRKYIKQFDSSIYKSYNSIMHGYVLIPDKMLEDLDNVAKYLEESYDYVMSL